VIVFDFRGENVDYKHIGVIASIGLIATNIPDKIVILCNSYDVGLEVAPNVEVINDYGLTNLNKRILNKKSPFAYLPGVQTDRLLDSIFRRQETNDTHVLVSKRAQNSHRLSASGQIVHYADSDKRILTIVKSKRFYTKQAFARFFHKGSSKEDYKLHHYATYIRGEVEKIGTPQNCKLNSEFQKRLIAGHMSREIPFFMAGTGSCKDAKMPTCIKVPSHLYNFPGQKTSSGSLTLRRNMVVIAGHQLDNNPLNEVFINSVIRRLRDINKDVKVCILGITREYGVWDDINELMHKAAVWISLSDSFQSDMLMRTAARRGCVGMGIQGCGELVRGVWELQTDASLAAKDINDHLTVLDKRIKAYNTFMNSYPSETGVRASIDRFLGSTFNSLGKKVI